MPRPKTEHGKKAEEHAAKRMGGELTPNSGSTDKCKGDLHLGNFKIESKSTINGSIRLERSWLIKIAQEAVEQGMDPALMIQFVTESGKARPNGSWVMVPEFVFQELIEGD